MGIFKKIVIADRLAIIVDAVYNSPEDYSGFSLMLATIFFTFQIYCDFSGYSDIAIGAARVMGFELIENFKRPYFSKSISEFGKDGTYHYLVGLKIIYTFLLVEIELLNGNGIIIYLLHF